MKVNVSLPKVDYDMETGSVVEWLVKVGDRVAKGDAFASVQSEKAVVEVEAPAAGIVATLLASVGETVPVGATIAEIEVDAAGR